MNRMFEQQQASRPRYETPIIIPFGESSQGHGQTDCADGSAHSGGGGCRAGGMVSGGGCRSGGQAGAGVCQNGDAPSGNCMNGASRK